MAKRTSGRIRITNSPKETIALAQAIYQKHLADGANSKLHTLEDIDVNGIGATVALAEQHQRQAEDYKLKMEQAYRDRDNLMDNITMMARASSAVLKAAYRKNPKKLGEWGIQVDDTTQNRKNNDKA